ncbi:MAG TPA: hypothetical protein VMY37_05055 [Thermoguttaceae bacterium]|nr:hypothetical protein [Thermoguttaceae bacterium]
MQLVDFLQNVYVPSRLDLSPPAAEQIVCAIRVFQRWACRPVVVADLNEDLVRRFLVSYLRTAAPATVNTKRGHLLALWQCAWEEGLRDAPPRRGRIRRAKAPARIPEAWTAAEVGRILAAARQESGVLDGIPATDWWTSLLLVMYDTGERRGAVLKTRPKDVSLAGGWVTFYATKTRAPRWCPLHQDTISACRRIYRTDRSVMWPCPYRSEWIGVQFRRILRRAGVTFGREHGGVFHKLRRTTGSLVEQAGGDGAKHIGNTRAVFLRHYCDPRFFSSQLDRLPRPTF